MVHVRIAGCEEFERVLAFYRANDYKPAVNPTDVIVVAETGGGICGVVRLCEEEDCLVLRGMRVRKDLQRRGIGTRILQSSEPIIGERTCFCIPYRQLLRFYTQIGFQKVSPSEAPSFLQERYNRYRFEYGLDVIMMCRR